MCAIVGQSDYGISSGSTPSKAGWMAPSYIHIPSVYMYDMRRRTDSLVRHTHDEVR